MKNILIVIVLLISGLAFAQVNHVTGNVLDGEFNNEPLAFARIIVKDTNQIVETDLDGNYGLNLKLGTYTFVYEFIGYEAIEVNNIIIDKKKITLNNVILNAKNLLLTNSIVSKG